MDDYIDAFEVYASRMDFEGQRHRVSLFVEGLRTSLRTALEWFEPRSMEEAIDLARQYNDAEPNDADPGAGDGAGNAGQH